MSNATETPIPAGTRVRTRLPGLAGGFLYGRIVDTHENRNPYAADRVAYVVRWQRVGVGSGWTADDLVVLG